MAKYRKKPVVVEAMQFMGTDTTLDDISNFITPSMVVSSIIVGKDFLIIRTLEGYMKASKGDYLVKGYSSERGFHYWPVKPDYFLENYELVTEE